MSSYWRAAFTTNAWSSGRIVVACRVYRTPRRPSEALLSLQERRQREDDAPRLLSVAPELSELRLKFHSVQAERPIAGTEYTKLVPVQHASAHFEIPCSDPRCKDGGHDITHDILYALRAHDTALEGEDACRGATGSAPCGRSLHYSMSARYKN
jgi:hypothetical protein